MGAFSIRTKLIAFLVGIPAGGPSFVNAGVGQYPDPGCHCRASQTTDWPVLDVLIATQHIRSKAEQLTESVRIAIQDFETRTQLVKGEAMTRQSVLINLAGRIKVEPRAPDRSRRGDHCRQLSCARRPASTTAICLSLDASRRRLTAKSPPKSLSIMAPCSGSSWCRCVCQITQAYVATRIARSV